MATCTYHAISGDSTTIVVDTLFGPKNIVVKYTPRFMVTTPNDELNEYLGLKDRIFLNEGSFECCFPIDGAKISVSRDCISVKRNSNRVYATFHYSEPDIVAKVKAAVIVASLKCDIKVVRKYNGTTVIVNHIDRGCSTFHVVYSDNQKYILFTMNIYASWDVVLLEEAAHHIADILIGESDNFSCDLNIVCNCHGETLTYDRIPVSRCVCECIDEPEIMYKGKEFDFTDIANEISLEVDNRIRKRSMTKKALQ